MSRYKQTFKSARNSTVGYLRSNRALTLLLVGLLVIGLATAGYKILRNRQLSTTANVGHLSLSKYQNFNEYKLQGKNRKSNMSFSKPVEVEELKSDSPSPEFVRLVHQGTSTSTGGTILTASIAEYGDNIPTKAQLSSVGVSLTSEKSEGHSSALESINKYLSAEFPGYEVSLSVASGQSTTSIKTNIWQFDFIAKADGKGDAGEDIYGKFILVAGKQGYYYFVVSAIKPVWDQNQDAWKQIINSLKVES